MWNGSGYDYSNLILTRRFHPPLRNHLLAIVNAEWLCKKHAIKLWLAAYKSLNITTDSQCYHDIIFTFSHETLHGVIESIMNDDKIRLTRNINYHFPFISGLDPFFSNTYKNAKAKARGHYIEPRT